MVSKTALLFRTTRPSFLVLTLSCVALGTAVSCARSGKISLLHSLLVLLGALAAHVSVNVFNEYFDFKNGLDAKTTRTPFSGGSGTLPANPGLAGRALFLAWLALALTAAVGLFFVSLHGWKLLPLGIAGLILLYGYTAWFAYDPFLCLLAPGIGFGLLMVTGTNFALTGSYSLAALAAALVPTFLVSNLLLLNQFPDLEADRSVGRRSYPVVVGRKASSVIYALFNLLAFLSIVVAVIFRIFPLTALIALAGAIPALLATLGALRNHDNPAALLPSLALNVLANILTPLLLAAGIALF